MRWAFATAWLISSKSLSSLLVNVNDGCVMVAICFRGFRRPLFELLDTPEEEAPLDDEELLLDGVSSIVIVFTELQELGLPECFALCFDAGSEFKTTALAAGAVRFCDSLPAVDTEKF
jgi:hypothetical protein